MAIYVDRVGSEWDLGTKQWTSKDALLYAIGVGAGSEDPNEELEFTTENSIHTEQQVLPTFGVVLSQGRSMLKEFGDFPLSSILHAEHALTLHSPLPVEGEAEVTLQLEKVQDKGSGAFILTNHHLRDVASGESLLTSKTTLFVRNEGGFGGERGVSTTWEKPEREPDYEVTYQVPLNQALIYRLSGDRNPLHSDPKAAEGSGFDRPILHGLCTFGYAGRALLDTVCDKKVEQFGHIATRFASPVYPGDCLSVRIWDNDRGALFQVHVGDRLVLDRGYFEFSD